MAITTDLTGTYDYEAEEANHEFDYLFDPESDYTSEELMQKVEKLQSHWAIALGKEGFRDFALQWNKRASDAGLSLGFYMISANEISQTCRINLE